MWAVLHSQQVELLIDTGATASIISLHLLQQKFPSVITDIQPSEFSLFAAGQHQLLVEGNVCMTLQIGNFELMITFMVITSSLPYVILGFDVLHPQGLFLDPSKGLMSLTPESDTDQDNDLRSIHLGLSTSTPIVNNLSLSLHVHECINVFTVNEHSIAPLSSATISVNIDFKNSTQPFVKGRNIIISSECLQPEVKDWNQLNIFFQLVPAEVLTQVIYTNKTSDMCHIKNNTLVACAEYAFSAVQLDPNITIDSAPISSLVHVINNMVTANMDFLPSIHEDNESEGFEQNLGIDLPLNEDDRPLDLSQISMGSATEHEKIFMEKLCTKYDNIISKSQWDIGLFDTEPAHISVKAGFSPKYTRQPALVDPSIRKVAASMIIELEKRGLIKKCQSPWSSPLLVLRKAPREYKLNSIKSDGSVCKVPGQKRSQWDPKAGLRFVISLKNLNLAAKPHEDQGILPKITEQLSMLKNYSVVHALDFSAAYWHLPLDESSQKLTSFFFTTPVASTQYCLTRLPQGFRDSSSIFTNRAHRFIHKYGLFNCLSYIDNFLICSTEDSAKADLEKVFAALHESGLKIRLFKSHFFLRNKVTLFGYTIDLQQHSVHPDAKKVDSILKLSVPSTKKEARSFLGKLQYYYRLIPSLNNILDPLFQIASPSAKFIWAKEHEKAFQLAKRQLAKGPLIYMPNDEGPRHLITDAAQKVGIASAIFDYDQQHNLFLPLRYTSHPLRGSQTNYSQFALEAFALIKGVKENIDLIMYTPCYIYTDCQSLVYLVRMRDLSTKAARWLEFLSGFNIKVVFLPSSNALLKFVDFLSRPSNIVKKKLKKPYHLDKNVFDFSDLKPCNIQLIIESLQKVFSQQVVNFISPSTEQTKMFEALPNLFSSTEEVFNHSFNHMIHAYDNQVQSQFHSSQNNSAPLDSQEQLGVDDSQKLVPFPKSYMSDPDDHKIIPPPSINFQEKINPSEGLTRQIIYEYMHPLTLEKLKYLQDQCDFCSRKRLLIDKGNTMFLLIHDILCFKQGNHPLKIVVPQEIAKDVIEKFHSTNKLMHASVDKMAVILKSVFFFQNFKKSALQVVKECKFCLQFKPNQLGQQPIFKSRLLFYPRKVISIDLVHISANLEHCVLTVVDLFSNFLIYIPILKGYTAVTIAKLLIERVFAYFGNVNSIVTDNEKSLISPMIVDIIQLLHCKHFSIVPRQSTSQGRVELSNKLLLQAFRYFKQFVTITDFNLGMLCALGGHFLNSIKSPAMPASPYYIMFGSQPPDIFLTFNSHIDFKDHDDYLKSLTLLQNVYFLVRKYHEHKVSKYPDEPLHNIKVGDFCLIKRYVDKAHPTWKLREKFQQQLYRIIKVFQKSVLIVKFGDTSTYQSFHGKGKILKKNCRRIRIQDIKILTNPTKFLKLSIPQKLLVSFSNYLAERDLMSKEQLDNLQMQSLPPTSQNNQLLPQKLLNYVQNGSLIHSEYFYLPSLKVQASGTQLRQAKKIKKSVLPGPVLTDSSMSSDSTLMVNKDRASVNRSNDDHTREEIVLEEDIPQHIETVRPINVTPLKKSVSTSTPSIPFSHIQSRRNVIDHPLHLTQDDSNFRKFDLENQSPRVCHTPPSQVQGASSFVSNFDDVSRTRSVTPDSEISPSTHRVDNWLDNAMVSAYSSPTYVNDQSDNLSSLQYNVPPCISTQVDDGFTADTPPVQHPSRTQARSVFNPDSVGYHVRRSPSSHVNISVPFSQDETPIIRDIPFQSSKPSKSRKRSQK